MRQILLEKYYESEEYKSKLRERLNVYQKCAAEPLNIVRYTVDIWANDPIAFIEQFGYILIPEFKNEIKPFFLFDYQKNVINKIHQAEIRNEDCEILIDKPRGMGLTWLLIWYEIWRWLFAPNWSGFDLSRSEAEVDDGNSDPSSSIFGKIRWAIGKLPAFMIPEGFVPKGKKGNSTDSMLRISNPQMHSTLVGSTTNQNAGRSRRYSFILVDECFSIEHFQSVYRSLQSVANVKVFISTVKAGKINRDFKDMCALKGNYISLSWKDHPFKDQEWYDEQLKKAEFDPEVMKEIEVDYSVNIKSQYYPEIRTAKSLPDISYLRDKPLYVSLDFGSQDNTVLIWAQFDGQYLNILECVSNRRKNLDWYVPFLNPGVVENPDHYIGIYKETLKKIQTWTKPVAYFGEAAHFQKVMPLNRSVADELIRNGIRLMCNNYAVKHEPRRHAVSQMLPRTAFNMGSDGVVELYDAIANSRYSESNRGVSKESHLKPVHDEVIADYRSAFENMCTNIPRIFRNQRKDIGDTVKQNNFAGNLIKFLKI